MVLPLLCDNCGGTEEFKAFTQDMAMSAAQLQGWTFTSNGAFCPSCVDEDADED